MKLGLKDKIGLPPARRLRLGGIKRIFLILFFLAIGTATYSDRLLSATPNIGQLETVALFYGTWPAGVAVSPTGRIFLSYPRLDDSPAKYTLNEFKDGKLVPYPNTEFTQLDKSRPTETLISAHSIFVDPVDRLWVIDTASLKSSPIIPNGAKLVCIDLKTNKIIQKITFPPDVVLPNSYLNDFRLDFTRGQSGLAYITDSSDRGPNGIIVVDLTTGESWRKLNNHPSVKAPNFAPLVEGKPLMKHLKGKPPVYDQSGINGIALSADSRTLYWTAEASYDLYAAEAGAIADRTLSDSEVAKTIQKLPRRNFASEGLEIDRQNRLYLTDLTHNAIQRRTSDGRYETLVTDSRIIWPDCLRLSSDGYLYFTVTQANRRPDFNAGVDLRKPPYPLFRIKVNTEPALFGSRAINYSFHPPGPYAQNTSAQYGPDPNWR